MRYDSDSSFQLAEFRTTLRIVPERLGGPNPSLIRDRTMALWEGLRRVYFGTTEVSPARDPVCAARAPIRTFNARTEILSSQGISEEQHETRHDGESPHHVPDDEPDPAITLEIEDLRREIAVLEARTRRRRAPDDSEQPLLPPYHDEDDDEPDPLELIYDFSTSATDGPRISARERSSAAPRTGHSSQQEDTLHPGEEAMPDNCAITKQPDAVRYRHARSGGSHLCDPANGEEE
jgi:hypothetical protein